MARRRRRRNIDKTKLNFKPKNHLFFIIGILLIIIGYITLPMSKEGWISLYLSPITLVAGYCVLIPLGILYNSD